MNFDPSGVLSGSAKVHTGEVRIMTQDTGTSKSTVSFKLMFIQSYFTRTVKWPKKKRLYE